MAMCECVHEYEQTSLSDLNSSSRLHFSIMTYQKFIKENSASFSRLIVVTKIMSIHYNPFDT